VGLRPMMIPSIIEKIGYVATLLVLYLQSRLHSSDLTFAAADLILGILFLVAFFKTAT
jgi:hypothetical protein